MRENWEAFILKEEVFDFIKLCYDHWKDDFRFLMLTNATKRRDKCGNRKSGLARKYCYQQVCFS